MPRGDRTGPRGMGAMTGRAAGYCAETGGPGYTNPAPGRGLGMGFRGGRGGFGQGFGGGRRGWRNMFHATGLPGWMQFGGPGVPYQEPDPEIERRTLKGQAKALQSELDLIKKRMGEIEPKTTAE